MSERGNVNGIVQRCANGIVRLQVTGDGDTVAKVNEFVHCVGSYAVEEACDCDTDMRGWWWFHLIRKVLKDSRDAGPN